MMAPHLDLLGQRNDVTLVKVYDSVHVDFVSFDVQIALNDVLCISGCFLLQSGEESLFHLGFSDQGFESPTVRLSDMGDKGSWILYELGFRDKFPWINC